VSFQFEQEGTYTMKTKLLAAGLLALGLAATAASAAEVTRTYVTGSYMYTCVAKGGGEYCGNFNVLK
jgi:spermidine/putrescine-binding protein